MELKFDPEAILVVDLLEVLDDLEGMDLLESLGGVSKVKGAIALAYLVKRQNDPDFRWWSTENLGEVAEVAVAFKAKMEGSES